MDNALHYLFDEYLYFFICAVLYYASEFLIIKPHNQKYRNLVFIQYNFMSLTSNFLRSFTNHLSQTTVLSEKMLKFNNLLVNYPIQLVKGGEEGHLRIVSKGHIRKDNDVLMLAHSECFFSSQLAGCAPQKQEEILQTLTSFQESYDNITDQFIGKTFLALSLLANLEEPLSGEMPLKHYANYIIQQQNPLQIKKSQINSRELMFMSEGIDKMNMQMYNYIFDILKRIDFEVYQDINSKMKCHVRDLRGEEFKYMAPFIDRMDHSNQPNCYFESIYLAHRRMPFVRIRTNRDIKPQQKLTLKYGVLGNHELMYRFSFTLPNNPFSFFYLPIMYANIMEIFNKNIQWKQKMLQQSKLNFRQRIKINLDGSINEDDFMVLRIIFNDSQYPKKEDLEKYELKKAVYDFVKEHASYFLSNLKVDASKVKGANKHHQTLEQEEQRCLINLINLKSY